MNKLLRTGEPRISSLAGHELNATPFLILLVAVSEIRLLQL